MKKFLLIFSFGIHALSVFCQTGNTCSDPLPFCTGTDYNFPAGVNSGNAQPGPDYGCLGSEPNPIWYFMQVEQPGLIQIFMVGTNNGTTPTNDIDFICYGPFSDLSNVCTGQLTAGNTVDCSYSAAPTETVDIPNAQTGDYYLLLITNFSNNPCNIIFSQSNEGASNAGTTDCGVISDSDNNGPLCEGDTLILTGSEQNGSNSVYSWFKVPDFSASLGNTAELVIPNVPGSAAGTYAFVVVDTDNNESDTSYTDVIIYDKPEADFSPLKICDGTPVSFQNDTQLNDTFGSVQDEWLWNFGYTDTPTGNPAGSSLENPTHTFPSPGNYDVTFTVTTNHGCADTLTQSFLVIEKPHPSFTYEMLCFEEVSFLNTSENGLYPIQTVAWDMGDGVVFDPTSDSLFTYIYAQMGTFQVTLALTDTAGCVSDSTLAVEVTATPDFDFPNIITPNGDGVNDELVFLPLQDKCYNYLFAVFNRWGNKVFQTESSENGFEGLSSLGSKLSDGVYFWVLTAQGISSKEIDPVLKKGNLTVVK
jgi:gliding motility-associated-like protein